MMMIPSVFFLQLINMAIPIIIIFVVIKLLLHLLSPNHSVKRPRWYNETRDVPPVLAVPAIVIAKRSDGYERHLTHFVAFEMESGDKFEFMVDPTTYSLLNQDDRGKLTFQGQEFRGFERMYDNHLHQ